MVQSEEFFSSLYVMMDQTGNEGSDPKTKGILSLETGSGLVEFCESVPAYRCEQWPTDKIHDATATRRAEMSRCHGIAPARFFEQQVVVGQFRAVDAA